MVVSKDISTTPRQIAFRDSRQGRIPLLPIVPTVLTTSGSLYYWNSHSLLQAIKLAQSELRQMAKASLPASADLFGVAIGYEPIADQSYRAFLATVSLDMHRSMDASRRFIPDGFRVLGENKTLRVGPQRYLDTSRYYGGTQQLFLKHGQPTAMITEPYLYEGRMIVEQSYPIIMDVNLSASAMSIVR